MATPLLRGLREHFPSARIYVLTSKQAVAGLQGSPLIDEIFEVPTSKKDWLSLLLKMRKERIDTAFILHRFFAASSLSLLAGIPQRLGFDWKNQGFALTGSIPFNPARSQTQQIGQLLTLLGKPAAVLKWNSPSVRTPPTALANCCRTGGIIRQNRSWESIQAGGNSRIFRTSEEVVAGAIWATRRSFGNSAGSGGDAARARR